MIGFGKDNEEFGKVPPSVVLFEEMKDEEGFANNSLLIRINTYTGLSLQIIFPSYIMYLTRNESYTAWDEEEIRQGSYLIVFSKSELIDFYDRVIIHTEDYSWPGKGTHYGVYSADHIIDVIADTEPIITQLNQE